MFEISQAIKTNLALRYYLSKDNPKGRVRNAVRKHFSVLYQTVQVSAMHLLITIGMLATLLSNYH